MNVQNQLNEIIFDIWSEYGFRLTCMSELELEVTS